MGMDIESVPHSVHDTHLLPEKSGYIFSYCFAPAHSPLPGTE